LPLGISYWQLHKEFSAAREKAGMPHVQFHDLRHTCASWLINAGVDLYTVGKILGHSGPATTARYAHLSTQTLEKAMARLR
jgi:integrase